MQTQAISLGIALASAAAGYALVARGVRWPVDALSKILLWFSIPYTVVYSVLTSDLTSVAITASVAAVAIGSAFPLSYMVFVKLLRLDPRAAGSAVLASALGNTAFLPIPLMVFVLGDASPAGIYSSIQSLVAAIAVPLTAGYILRSSGDCVSVIISMLRFPPAIALITSAIMRAVWGPMPWLPDVLAHLTNANSYLMLLSMAVVGASFHEISSLRPSRTALAIMVFRATYFPSVHAVALATLPLSGVWFWGLVIESITPPATMSIIYSWHYGFRTDDVAVAIAYLTPATVGLAAATALLS